VGTIILTGVAAYLIVDVALVVIVDQRRGFAFWCAIVVFSVLGVWTARRAADRWRTVATQRRAERVKHSRD